MTSSSAEAEGRRAQQELVQQILASFPELQPANIRSIPGSVPGEDLGLSPKAQELFPFAVEVRNVERLNFWEAIQQAESHASKSGRDPLLVFRRNNEKHRHSYKV